MSGDDVATLRGPRSVLVATLLVVLAVGAGLGVWRSYGAPTADRDASLAARPSLAQAPPVPVAPGQTYTRATVLPSGNIAGTQWIESPRRMFSLRLAPPDLPGVDEVSANDVRVVVDGRQVRGPTEVVGRPARFTFLGTMSVMVEYDLVGAVERSVSAPGRGLARVIALDADYEPAPERSVLSVVAPDVLALACQPAAGASGARPCGDQTTDGTWSVSLGGPLASTHVLAQVTLE